MVARRITEFGIRLALGATARDLRRMVIREAMIMLATAAAIGVPAAVVLRRLAGALVPDVAVNPALTVGAAMAAMTVVALAAAWLPARQAARTDPIEVLRHE
jgi:ABC-type antimicrobial peptide transport system permease subunit